MRPDLKVVASNDPPAPPPSESVPEQMEMPFAIVNGEPITELPRDLYIPPQALEVILEAFEGPLDLLLYLIRKQNIDILDIPIAEITRQYMQYIEVMQELHLELAGEYLVMAATLAEIKSRMLLPRPQTTPEQPEEDPRAELVRRLQEYERFKRAAEDLDSLPRLERDVWIASAPLKDRKVVRMLPQPTLQEMLKAFREVVIRAELFAHHHIQRERLSVRERMSNILSTLERSSFVEFVRLFRPEEGRMGVTVTFLAILELVREGLIEVVQAQPYAPLHVRAAAPGRKLRVISGNGEAAGAGEDGAQDGEAAMAEEDVMAGEDDQDVMADDDAQDEHALMADDGAQDEEAVMDDDVETADEVTDEWDAMTAAAMDEESRTDDGAGTDAAAEDAPAATDEPDAPSGTDESPVETTS